MNFEHYVVLLGFHPFPGEISEEEQEIQEYLETPDQMEIQIKTFKWKKTKYLKKRSWRS